MAMIKLIKILAGLKYPKEIAIPFFGLSYAFFNFRFGQRSALPVFTGSFDLLL